MKIAMTPSETSLFSAFVSAADHYLEFGAGGSTVLAANHVRSSIISVDSSDEWLAAVSAATATKLKNIRLCKVDIGPTREWGAPADESMRHLWPLYSQSIWSEPNATSADLYLIDGRFRVCCFAETISRAKIGAIVLIHDFATRPAYHVVNTLARRIAVCEALSAFVKDDNSSVADAKQMANDYRFNFY